jgi:hypothetical protein
VAVDEDLEEQVGDDLGVVGDGGVGEGKAGQGPDDGDRAGMARSPPLLGDPHHEGAETLRRHDP